ncbi:hypothetical protein VTJ04DRAFT_8253 [Mycothermus thermophilus]|uniref:uncharacterized protein n=1 Tax=Humicola insolens TaxID=85995 RepID=UPI0037447F40
MGAVQLLLSHHVLDHPPEMDEVDASDKSHGVGLAVPARPRMYNSRMCRVLANSDGVLSSRALKLLCSSTLSIPAIPVPGPRRTQLAAELPPLSDLPPSLLLSSQQTTPSPPGQFDRDLESTAQPLISSSSRLRNSAAARLASSTSHCYPRPRLVFRQHLALQLIPPPGVLALCLSCASRHFLLLSRAPVLVLICPPTVSIRWLSLAHFPCAPFRDSHLERLSVTFRYPSAEHHLDNDMT